MRQTMTFENWMEKVDNILELTIGLASDELPDYLYRDAHDQGRTPLQAVNDCLHPFINP